MPLAGQHKRQKKAGRRCERALSVSRVICGTKVYQSPRQPLLPIVSELANLSGVTPSTVYSLLDERRRDVSIITIKKLCDGLDISLGEFFSTPEFEALEQEIQ